MYIVWGFLLLRSIMCYKIQVRRAPTSSFSPCKAVKLNRPLLPECNHQFNERDRDNSSSLEMYLFITKAKGTLSVSYSNCF